ncbi:peptidase S41 [Chitinophaga silvatica]|uniref:Peptidase S41 n=1 Tax=Chitinophaga silvatica TaxID=2282649 RepID=A0A3E1Y880_9BACT|nr:S41 family peptidase [Chitinophaga silvatica]RFS21078.1 peptidase S41 [Chitinophaga silvatica]
MRINLLLVLTLCLFTTEKTLAQTCDCKANFEWVKKTFEENDAGFQYALNMKGKDAFEAHNQKIAEKVKTAKTTTECANVLDEWLRFFRNGHKYLVAKNPSPAPIQITTGTIPANWETLNIDVNDFKKEIAKKKDPEYEGIWKTQGYELGITKKGNEYIAFVINSEAPGWTSGKLKFRINIATKDATYYKWGFDEVKTRNVEFLGKNHLIVNNVSFKRVFPENLKDEPKFEEFDKAINASSPYFVKRNATTCYLRIPSFHEENIPIIDSILNANKKLLLNTKNLIIDVRNNGGGSDFTYNSIIPYLYTNPIRRMGIEFFSTKLNNQRMLKLIENEYFSASEKERFKRYYEVLEKHIGEFVNLDNKVVNIDTLKTQYKYPQNVGIIINGGCGSATEQFLLEAKQSKKVKLFGVTTFGSLDISNMNMVVSPDGEFELGYCLSRSLRIPGFAIDGKGLQPDYFMDDVIEEPDWIDFVNDTLNK